MSRELTTISILVLICLNIVDVLYTMYWFRMGIAELNPVLAPYAYSQVQMMSVKMGLAMGGCLVFWKARNARLAKPGMVILLGVYTMVVGYHLWFMVCRY